MLNMFNILDLLTCNHEQVLYSNIAIADGRPRLNEATVPAANLYREVSS